MNAIRHRDMQKAMPGKTEDFAAQPSGLFGLSAFTQQSVSPRFAPIGAEAMALPTGQDGNLLAQPLNSVLRGEKRSLPGMEHDVSAKKLKVSGGSASTSNLLSHNDSDDASVVMPSTEGFKDYAENDVLSGRGGGTNVHPGNRTFREMINVHRRAYLKARKNDKPAISRAIVRAIRKTDGRFLKKDEKTGLWFEIGDDAAREKTSQALRQRAPEMRKLLFDSGRSQGLESVMSPQQRMMAGGLNGINSLNSLNAMNMPSMNLGMNGLSAIGGLSSMNGLGGINSIGSLSGSQGLMNGAQDIGDFASGAGAGGNMLSPALLQVMNKNLGQQMGSAGGANSDFQQMFSAALLGRFNPSSNLSNQG